MAAIDLRLAQIVRVGLVFEQDRAGLVKETAVLAFGQGDGEE